MTTKNLTTTMVESQSVKPAHRQRGKRFDAHARDFIARFPHGTTLSQDEFCHWAAERGLMPYVATPEFPNGRRTDYWKANLMRRHEVRYNLNKAGTHPRMNHGENPLAFSLDSVTGNTLEVRFPHVSYAENKLASAVTSLVAHKRKGLKYLLESADFSRLSVPDQTRITLLDEDIGAFEDRLAYEAKTLNQRVAVVRNTLRHLSEQGESEDAGKIAEMLTIEYDGNGNEPRETDDNGN
jgi:hypothetical protein